MNKKKRKTKNTQSPVRKTVKDIKELKVQGATNVARAALEAYSKSPSASSKKLLLGSRPTEPLMWKALDLADKMEKEKILKHFDTAREKIKKNSLRLIKNKDRIFTHCHSSTTTQSLIYAKKKGRRFKVYNTETRPRYQGRKTAKELGNAGIDVTLFVDSTIANVLEKSGKKDDVYANKILLGADALTKKGVINKVGSYSISRLAYLNKIPIYILSDSWKYSSKKVPIEKRSFSEVWENPPKKVKIKNPSFEMIPKKYIKGIVTELGYMDYEKFLKKMK